MLDCMSSSTRRIAISRSRNSPTPVEFIVAIHVVGWPLMSRRTTEPRNAMPISSDQPSHMPRPPAGPLTSAHRICLDLQQCSRYVLHSQGGASSRI